MALIKCSECGKEISDKADKCPNCGCPVNENVSYSGTYIDTNNNATNINTSNNKKSKKTFNTEINAKKKDSTLSIFAIVLSLFGCTAPIAFILALVDLCMNDKNKKHTGSWFAIIVIVIWASILIFGGNDNKENTTEISTEATTEATTEETTTESQETEEEYRASCEEYKFKDVLRNPENYVGKRVKVTVQINSVHEENILNASKYYFGYSENEYGFYGDCYAIFDERENIDLKLLSDDVVTVYGEIAEPEYTSSLILNSEEVFSIKMKYVDLISE